MKQRIVITGAAGFIGSHLSEALLDRGYEVIGIDNLLTGDTANIAHLVNRDFTFIKHDVTNYIYVEGAGPFRPALGEPGQPDRLPRAADSDAEGRRAGHAQGAGPREGQGRAVRARVHVGGLRRSAGASAEGIVLGQRQPGRPARRVRRGEAVRRGDDDGLPPLSRGGHEDRPHLQHLRTAHARSTTAAPSRPSCRRRSGNEDVTVFGDGTQTRSFTYISDLVDGIIRLMLSSENDPINIGNPREMTIEEIARTIIKMTGAKSQIVYKPLPTDDPKVRQPDITRARTLLKWEPKVALEEGLVKTIEYFSTKVGAGG